MTEDDDVAGETDLEHLGRLRRAASDDESARSVGPGRLTARQRVAALLEPDSFLEIGALAVSQQPSRRASTPGDGVVSGFGIVAGQRVAVISEDATVLGNTDGQVGNAKRRRVLKLALAERLPIVFLADGPTAAAPIFPADAGELFGHLADQRDHADLGDRRSLLISVVLGSTAGKSRELVLDSDVVVDATGDAGIEADFVADNDPDAMNIVTRLIRLSPPGPTTAASGPRSDPPLLEGPPGFTDEAADPSDMAGRLADPGSLLDLSAQAESGLLAALMTVGGLPLAVAVSGAAGQRMILGRDIFRLHRLVKLCLRLDLPLLLVQDCVGYSPEVMEDRHSAAALAALVGDLRHPQLPLICLVTGSGHVLGTFCLGGRQLEPIYVAAWPWAQVGVTDTSSYEVSALTPHRHPDPWLAAGLGLVDDVLTPAETGPWLRWLVSLVSRRRAFPPMTFGNRWYGRASPRGL